MNVLTAISQSIVSRHQAADLLKKVADCGSWGGFPQDVTCEEIGRALERICINSPEQDPLMEVLKGWREAERKRNARLQEIR